MQAWVVIVIFSFAAKEPVTKNDHFLVGHWVDSAVLLVRRDSDVLRKCLRMCGEDCCSVGAEESCDFRS